MDHDPLPLESEQREAPVYVMVVLLELETWGVEHDIILHHLSWP